MCAAQSQSASQVDTGRGRLARPYRYLMLFWTVVFYLSLAFSLYDLYQTQPERLSGWSGALLATVLIVFCSLYHIFYTRGDNWWPMPPGRARLYFPLMTLLLAVLVWFNPGFSGVGYALIAHACTLLRWKYWFVPITPIAFVIGWSYGLFVGDIVGVAIFGFSLMIIIGTFAGIYVLTQQHYQLGELVHELQHAKQELELHAEASEELAVLRERTRLAREMHDSIGHALVAVNVKLEAAERLYRKDAARGNAELAETRMLVRETLTELRHSLGNLRSPVGSYADLPAALESLATDACSRGLDVRLELAHSLPLLSEERREIVWRVAREALSNVERHAAAASATVMLAPENNSLLLRIIDDGSGIAPGDLRRPGHFGIIGMGERVSAIGGTLVVQSRPEGGTLVEARMPLSTPPAVKAE